MKLSPADSYKVIRDRLGNWLVRRREAFTLVELLVVIAVIVILIGITLKIAVFVNQKVGKTQALSDLEQLKNALASYYAECGSYPPTDRVRYEHFTNLAGHNLTSIGLQTGLVFYLWATYNPDPAAQKWQHYLQSLRYAPVGLGTANEASEQGIRVTWTNQMHTVYDPWGQEYMYRSQAPYQSYRLWTRGPDMIDGTVDDLGIGWVE